MYVDTTGQPVTPPKGRSYAAIRRSCMTAAQARCMHAGRTGMTALRTRAYQYALWLAGVEAPHSGQVRLPSYHIFEIAVCATGEKRIKRVFALAKWRDIPHWDFAPDQYDIFS